MIWVFAFMWCVVFGFWAYHIAKQKNRDAGFAIIAGMLFGIFAIIHYHYSPKGEGRPYFFGVRKKIKKGN